jgi:glyoxylase-like metal-dependent hydrolase (beta-lactamase superfamily II)
VPLDLFGQLTGVADSSVPWAGPVVRVLEHHGHAPGHAALFIEATGVLVAGDMLSDVFPPMPALGEPSWARDYLAGLQLLENAEAQVVIPGHGSVSGDVQSRIDLDRAYVVALRDGAPISDSRIDSPKPGWEWVADFLSYQRGRAGA